MADKGFGVREVNLIGATGTPFIESPNNLNINAVNVAISTNMTVGGNITIGDSTITPNSIGIGTTDAAGRDAGVGTATGTLIYDAALGLQVYTGDQWRTIAGTSVEGGGGTGGNMSIVITSDAIANTGDVIADGYRNQGMCGGNNDSPQLTWTVTGANTDVASFRLRCLDEDASNFVHWSVDGIAAATGSIAENAAWSGANAGVTVNATDFPPGGDRANGWGGPCPMGTFHTYNIQITAHDSGGNAVTQDGINLVSNILSFEKD